MNKFALVFGVALMLALVPAANARLVSGGLGDHVSGGKGDGGVFGTGDVELVSAGGLLLLGALIAILAAVACHYVGPCAPPPAGAGTAGSSTGCFDQCTEQGFDLDSCLDRCS